MSDLYITEPGSSLHKDNESLHLRKDGKTIFEIELKNVTSIQLFGRVEFSTPVAHEFLERGIEFAFYTSSGKLLGQLTPPYVKNVDLRFNQYKLSEDESFKLKMAKELVRNKFVNSLDFLKSQNKNREGLDIKQDIEHLKEYIKISKSISTISELMGKEGSFASAYFNVYGKLFIKPDSFQGRNKRPPKDPVNAVMSFLYTIMTNRIAHYLDGIGFDPYIGFLHGKDYGRVSLGCDLIELIRANFCDRLTVKLFNKKILQEQDFETKQDEGVILTRDGMKKFFKQFTDELNSEVDYCIVKGKFSDFLQTSTEWLKQCILEKQVNPIIGV